jgi:sulfur dioxygenase
MNPIQLFDPASSTYTYILFDEASRDALIIDPVDEQLQRDLVVLKDHDLTLRWSVETHAHADHVTSAGRLAELTGAQTAAPAGCHIGTATVQLEDGQVLAFGSRSVQALLTPGHTAGSMCFYGMFGLGQHLFTGDTLLINGCGRTDFQSGSPEALFNSLANVLFKLPAQTTVWPGHDYQGRTHSSIGHEMLHNIRVAGKTLAQFVETMNNLNLPKPQRMDEAVPANLTSGLRHDAGGDALLAVRPVSGYAGDVSPQLAWAWVQSGEAALVDVRTDAERTWVGFVTEAHALAWKQWPGMAINPEFDAGIQALGVGGKKLVLLCRSGVRSIAAAQRATELGLQAYNILEGFEGDPDGQAHRGNSGGWRFHGLPWRQA